jgi:hypothetical protein
LISRHITNFDIEYRIRHHCGTQLIPIEPNFWQVQHKKVPIVTVGFNNGVFVTAAEFGSGRK